MIWYGGDSYLTMLWLNSNGKRRIKDDEEENNEEEQQEINK